MIGVVTPEIKQFPQEGEVLIYFVFEEQLHKDPNLEILNKKTNSLIASKIKTFDFKGKDDEVLVYEVNGFYKHIFVAGLGKSADFTLLKLKDALAEITRRTQTLKHSSIHFFYRKEFGTEFFELGKHCTLGFYLGNYQFMQFKGEKEQKKTHYVTSLSLFMEQALPEELLKGIMFGKCISEGMYLARNLVNQPASHVHPETLVETAFAIEKESKGKIKVEILDEEECRRLGMNAFLAVGQGSERKPKFIVLHYQSDGKTKFLSQVNSSSSGDSSSNIHSRKNFVSPSGKEKKKSICLIGKSITFDSGGLSLKSSDAMTDMKIDMAGGAAVLGVFKILSDLSCPVNVYGILPACENMPSGKAIKPGDIVKAMNGKTIEILNTDAEGRVVLADTLAYAEEHLKPDVIIDLATLTGACIVALGHDIAGMFGNNESLLETLSQIAKKEGDELWKMPLYKPYAVKMKSDTADLKNIGGGKYGGAITAALFLSEFVEKTPWIHIDIAGPAYNGDKPKGVVPKGGTGWGIQTLINYICL